MYYTERIVDKQINKIHSSFEVPNPQMVIMFMKAIITPHIYACIVSNSSCDQGCSNAYHTRIKFCI